MLHAPRAVVSVGPASVGRVTVAAEVRIGAGPERIWRALREREELRRWHGWDADSLDAEIEHIYFQDATEQGRGTLLLGGTRIEVGDDGTVRFVMTAPPEDPLWQGWYDSIEQGWLAFAQQLRFALERHPGEDRVSAFREGGVDLDVPQQPGERYAAAGLTGEVWYRSPRQLGLTVDRWNDGLLVLMPDGAILTGYGVTPELP